MNWNYDLIFWLSVWVLRAPPRSATAFISVLILVVYSHLYNNYESEFSQLRRGKYMGLVFLLSLFFFKQCAFKKWPNKHRANISFWQNPPVCDLNGSDIIESARINIIWWRVAVEKWYRSKSGLTSCV